MSKPAKFTLSTDTPMAVAKPRPKNLPHIRRRTTGWRKERESQSNSRGAESTETQESGLEEKKPRRQEGGKEQRDKGPTAITDNREGRKAHNVATVTGGANPQMPNSRKGAPTPAVCMCVCVCMCMCVCVCVYIYVYICVCIYVLLLLLLWHS